MAFITPETGVTSTPSNAEEKQSRDLTRRILRFFASGELRLKKSRGSQTASHASFQMKGGSISAAKGNISIVNVNNNNYNGSSYIHQNSGASSSSSDGPLTTVRPRFLDKLPRFSMWDIQTEDRLRDDGCCRVYAAKVNGKRALVKEFYGENATKAWVATARFHAVTHFAPEFLHLIGASSAYEWTVDEEGVEMNPFLLLELDDLQPWKRQYAEEINIGDTGEKFIRCMILISDLLNIICYLAKLEISGIIIPGDVSLYQRSVNRHGLIYSRPTLSLNYSRTAGDICDTASLAETVWLDAIGVYPFEDNDDDAASSATSSVTWLMTFNASETEVEAAYSLGEFMYPNPFVTRCSFDSNTRVLTIIVCLWTKSCKPRSTNGLLDEMMARGAITPQERKEAIVVLAPNDPLELAAASSEGSDSDSKSDVS